MPIHRGGWNGKFSFGDDSNSTEESIDIYDHEKGKIVGRIDIDGNGVIEIFKKGKSGSIVTVDDIVS